MELLLMLAQDIASIAVVQPEVHVIFSFNTSHRSESYTI